MAFTLQIKQKIRHWLVHADLSMVLMMTFLFCRKVRKIIKQLYFIIRTELDEEFFLTEQKVKTDILQ